MAVNGSGTNIFTVSSGGVSLTVNRLLDADRTVRTIVQMSSNAYFGAHVDLFPENCNLNIWKTDCSKRASFLPRPRPCSDLLYDNPFTPLALAVCQSNMETVLAQGFEPPLGMPTMTGTCCPSAMCPLCARR